MAINTEKEEKQITLTQPMLAGKSVLLYTDRKNRTPQMWQLKVAKKWRTVSDNPA